MTQASEKQRPRTAPDGREVAWAPQEGPQEEFLLCPVFEVLLAGERGGGKTDALVMDFAQHVGVGWGAEWRGILFRQTYKQLSDVVAKTSKWFRLIFPGAEWNKSDYCWTFPDGEKLFLRHILDPEDYWNYHGHAYPWVGWEELTNWPNPDCFKRMLSCVRSTVPQDRRDRLGRPMPRKCRATTNPYGPGMNWIKKRYRLPAAYGKVIRDARDADGNPEPDRVAIEVRLKDNPALLEAEPGYMARVLAAARNRAEAEAWSKGSWDVASGGMFDDVWDPRVHVVDPFEVPAGWRVDRSFDWGSSKPFSCGVWAESDGSPYINALGQEVETVRGDVFRVGEWYGCRREEENVGLRMEPGEVARGIRDLEARLRERKVIRCRVLPGAADSAMWTADGRTSHATEMAAAGVQWVKADKGPGSRKQGWELIRARLKAALDPAPREKPALFVFRDCEAWLRTVPSLGRDMRDPDDVDTEGEDHAADETRYRLRKRPGIKQRPF
jgi:hypothetical protein